MSVYFIKVGRYIKVGFSENPQRRCERLWNSGTRYGRPWDMTLDEHRELLLAIEGDKSDEHHCHEALSDYYSGCEWFIDEPGVREFMTRAAKLIAGKRRPFPKVDRPGGEFEPVPYWEMPPERQAENDRMVKRARDRYFARGVA